MEYIKDLDSTVEKTMSPFKKTFYLKAVLHLILVLYAAKLAPSLPQEVFPLFENQYFKLFIFALVLWTAQFSPSTSLLISISFLVSMNAVNKKPLWEFLENVATEEQKKEEPQLASVTPEQSVQAVQVLADAAALPTAAEPNVIANVANIAAANVSTPEGVDALKQLAEQAVTPAPGAPEKVAEAVKEVVAAIQAPAPAPAPAPAQGLDSAPALAPVQGLDFAPALAPAPAPTPVESVQAVNMIAQAAASEAASEPQAVLAAVNIVAPNVTTPEGADALKKLAEQAIAPAAGAPEKVAEAVKEVVAAIQAPAPVPELIQAPTELPPPQASVEAVKLLAQAAAHPEASSPEAVSNAVNIAAANATTPEAQDALKVLAVEAATPGSASPEVIAEAVKEIVSSIPVASDAVPVGAPIPETAQKVAMSEPAPVALEGCFPIRRFDMNKVESSTIESKSSNAVFEDYAEWVPLKK